MLYDIAFRKQVLKVKKSKGLSLRAVAKHFGISPNTVYLWTKRLTRMPRKVKAYKVDMEALKKDVEDQPDAYLHERAERLGVTKQAIFYALKRLGVSYKKNAKAPQGERRKTAYLRGKD